jgi:phospholipid transport system substrate-binding protein
MTEKTLQQLPTRRSVLIGSVCASTTALVFGLPAPQAWALSAAESFVQTTGTQILGIVNSGASDSSKKQRFYDLLNSRAAKTKIAYTALGRYSSQWDSMSGGTKSEYKKLVMRFIASVFVRYNAEFAGESLDITRSSVRSANDIIVYSKVKFAGGRTLDVNWRVTTVSGSYKVFDVNVSGVWVLLQAKSEFESIISSNGGTIDGLISYLQQNA